MTLLFALLGSLLVQAPAPAPQPAQDPPQVKELQDRVKLLQEASLRDARTIQRLKQIIKALEAKQKDVAAAPKPRPQPQPKPGPGVKPEPVTPEPDAPSNPVIGPDRPLKGRVVFVDAKNKFVMVDIGLPDGVRLGYRFEINRVAPEKPGGQPKTMKLGVGIFEKYMGGNESMSKLNIIEGDAGKMRLEDEAVAIRKLGKVAPQEPKPGERKPIEQGVYRITGRAGVGQNAGFIIDYGADLGARQTDMVFAYKDGNLKAKMRLDTVAKGFSVANIINGQMIAPLVVGDQIYTRELKKQLNGKVVLVDDQRGIAVDVRRREGAAVGQRFEIRRQGKKIGEIVLADVQSWGAWAKVSAGTSMEDIQRGDFAELIKEE